MPYLLPAVAGTIAALVTALTASRIPRDKAKDLYTTLMAVTAFIYVGSALSSQKMNVLVLETAIAVVLFNVTLAGRWRSMRFTAAAFCLHGIWDLLHSIGAGAYAGPNFPVLCIAYDWVIAGFIWRLEQAGNEKRQLSQQDEAAAA